MVRFFGHGVYCGVFFGFAFMNTVKYFREQQKSLIQLLKVEGAEKTVAFSLVFSFFPSTKDFSKGSNLMLWGQ